jgi:M6 family metalloprotease-like protein
MRHALWVLAMLCVAGCRTQEEPSNGPEQHQASGLASGAARVSQLNARLLAPGAARPEELERVLAERAKALESLVAVDARAALALALPEEALSRLTARHPKAAAHLERRGQWEGELEVVIVDSPELRELRTDHTVLVEGVRHAVRFSRGAPEGLRSGAWVRLRGVKVGRHLAIEEAQEVARASALPEQACTSTGVQRSIAILVNQPGVPQPSLTTEQVREVFFSTTQRSLSGYWSEVSDGRTSTTGDVVGWYTLSRDYACGEYWLLRDEALQLADADVDFTQYDRIFIVHPAPPEGCDYGGRGTLSCGTVQTQDGAITASTSWLRAEYMWPLDSGVELTSHEGGHNLSLNHASSRDHGTEALGPTNSAGSRAEYGDSFSSMGFWNLGHYAAPHKAQLGWLAPGQVQLVDSTDGTFTLTPYSASGGLKALKVRRGFHGESWLWLEYRQPVGPYDSTLGAQVFGGALVHYEDGWTGSHTHLLDFTPETDSFADPAFLPGSAGATWTDPYTNLRLTVHAATPEGLTVSVQYEQVPCVPGTHEVRMDGLQEFSAPGWDAEFDVEVVNRDTLGCLVTSFYPSALVPPGWTLYTELPERLVIPPGHTGYFTLGATVPADATPGPYTFQTTVSRDDVAQQASASVEVLPPCEQTPPTVSLSPAAVSVEPGTTAAFNVTLSNHDSVACGWSYFELASALPQGWSTSYQEDQTGIWLAPGESGTVTVFKGVPGDATLGSYTVDVQVLRGSELVGSATATATIACNPLDPVLSLSPGSGTVEPGSSVSYTVTLTNRDPALCGASTFALSSPLPSGWAGSFSAQTLTVAPGQTVTATLTKTAPTTTKAGSFPVEARASRDGAVVASAQATAVVPCTRAAPSVGFLQTSATVEAGQSVTYDVTVKNTDTAGCAASGFWFSATAPSGWTSGLSPSAAEVLEPGASLTLRLTTTPPETTVAGLYTVSLSANRSGLSGGTASATTRVTEPPLKVVLSVPASSYRRGNLVPLTATVTRGTRAVASASVRFNLNRPDGRTASATLSTDATGRAVWSYDTQVRGTHTVTSTATSGTETVTSNTVSFSVN